MGDKIFETKAAKDAAKRFRMLCEYTFNITEDDGEQDFQQDDNEQNNGMDNPNVEQMNGNEVAPDETNMNNNINDVSGNDMNNGATGFNPSEDAMQSSESDFQNDDEVIDVDDLTNSQEETEEKVDDIQITMDKGFEKLLGVVEKLDKMIDASTENMEQLKKEFEKRNPTPLEKLNMRAANDSYPFNISPKEYWDEKEKNSNYRIGGENENDAKQYTITQGDIDGITDFQRISKELDDSSFNQNLMNIFGLR